MARGYSTNSPSAANMSRPSGFSEQVDRNRQASAMYAAQDAARGGSPVPAHLQGYLPGGADFDASRGRESALGNFMGGVADRIDSGARAISGRMQSGGGGLAPSSSPRPVARGASGVNMVSGVSSYLPGGVNTANPGSFMNTAAANLTSGGGLASGITNTLEPYANRFDNFMVGVGLAAPREFRSAATGAPGWQDQFLAGSRGDDADRSSGFGLPAAAAPMAGAGAPTTTASDPQSDVDIEEIERRNRERSMVPEFKEGGRIGPGGTAFRPDGTIDSPLNAQGMGVPPSIAALLGTGDMPGPGLPQMGGQPMYSYQMGGQVGPGGQPMPMAGGQPGLAEPGMQGQQLPPEAAQQHIQQFVQQNPEQVQQIQAMIQQGLQTGEITEQQLTLATQMATVVASNPEMYPQFVNTMVQQGLFDQGDLPAEFDPGLIYSLMIAGQSLQQGAQQGMQEPMMSMEEGGPLPSSSPNPDGSIPINAHEGEYVIPAEVVRAKGTDFFDKMIQQYKEKGAEQ